MGSASVDRLLRLGEVGCGRPASQQVQRFLRTRTWLGGVGEEGQAVVGGDVHAVEAEAELTNAGVVEQLDGGGVEADVVDCPVGAEHLALGRELADEV